MQLENFGKLKPKEELQKQAESVEKVLGKEMYPPDSTVDVLDISTIKDQYKTRYEAYVASLRALRNGGEIKTEEIRRAKEWIKGLNNLDTYIKEHESKDNPLLREKQYIVFKKIRDFLEQGKRKGYIKLPTGTGKTVLFLKIAEALDMRTLIVSPSKIILHQNAKETEKFTDSEFGKYYGLEKDLNKKVTHITYNSLVNAVRDGKINPDNIPVLILDEAHRSLGSERMQAINKFNGLQLGFTATSEFSEDKKVSDLLEEEIFRMDVADGIREGLLCNTQAIFAYTNVDLSNVDITGNQYNQEQLEKVINIQGRNLAAVELYKKQFSNLKAFCNCSGVKHAQAVAKLFNEKGIPAAYIVGDTPQNKRNKILEDYENGAMKILINARVLLEGFDEQSCSVTFNLHPTLSLVDAEQRARSGRLDKNNPDKWNYVIDFIDKNSKKPQVLYSEILGADRVWDISTSKEIKSIENQGQVDKANSEPRPPINFDGFSLDGLNVTIDTQHIMEVTNTNLESREKNKKKEWTFETLQADVRATKIKSSWDYYNSASKYGWPHFNTLTSMPEFPKKPDGSNDWDAFLGREKFDFKTLQAKVRAKKIKSSWDYQNNASKYGWPMSKILTSKPEFPKKPDGSNDWDAFLGREKFDFKTLQTDIRAKGIKTSTDYGKNVSKYGWPIFNTLTSKPEFPKKPDGSNDWDTFLGRKKFDFKTLQTEVMSNRIRTSRDYENNSSKYNWPNRKKLTSMPEFPKKPDGSSDWATFLGGGYFKK